jgi:hypothetical protein
MSLTNRLSIGEQGRMNNGVQRNIHSFNFVTISSPNAQV